jgi:predicted ATPase
MIRSAARGTQVVVVTHSASMREHLGAGDIGGQERSDPGFGVVEIELYKEWGETRISGPTTLTAPPWDWGKR